MLWSLEEIFYFLSNLWLCWVFLYYTVIISIEGPVVKFQRGIIQVTFNFGETSSSLFNSLGNFHHWWWPANAWEKDTSCQWLWSDVFWWTCIGRQSLLNTILPIPEMDIKTTKQSPRAIDQPFSSLAITCPYALASKDMIWMAVASFIPPENIDWWERTHKPTET